MIEQAKFTYSPLGKAFEKQIKTIEDQGEKQIEAFKELQPEKQTKSVEAIFPKGYENVEVKNKINKIKEYEKKVNRNNMIYYSSKYVLVKIFIIYSGKITINEANEEQADLIEYILNFSKQIRSKYKDDKK